MHWYYKNYHRNSPRNNIDILHIFTVPKYFYVAFIEALFYLCKPKDTIVLFMHCLLKELVLAVNEMEGVPVHLQVTGKTVS